MTQSRHDRYALGPPVAGQTGVSPHPIGVVAIVLCLAALQCGPGPVGSIGAVLGRDTNTGAVHVREAPDGLGAAEAGILPGDRLKMVNGVLVDNLDRSRIQALVRGPVDSKVTLTIIRGQDVLHLEVTRQALGTAPTVAPAEERIE